MQERLLFPDTIGLTAVWDRVQERPSGLAVSVRVTTSAKPLTPLTMMVEDPLSPVLIPTAVGLALMTKSWTAIVTKAW